MYRNETVKYLFFHKSLFLRFEGVGNKDRFKICRRLKEIRMTHILYKNYQHDVARHYKACYFLIYTHMKENSLGNNVLWKQNKNEHCKTRKLYSELKL